MYTSDHLSVYRASARGSIRLDSASAPKAPTFQLEIDFLRNRFEIFDKDKINKIKELHLDDLVAVQEVGVHQRLTNSTEIKSGGEPEEFLPIFEKSTAWRFGLRLWYDTSKRE